MQADPAVPLWKVLAQEFTNITTPHGETVAASFAAELDAVEREFERQGGTKPGNYGDLRKRALETQDEDAFLAAFFSLMHELPEKRAALCFSGGGIRSATFGLGVLQGLARTGLLKRFQYLSTVSGGGYLGSWFSAWIARHPQGRDGAIQELAATPETKIDPEPQPVRHLRSFGNYLSPRLGLLSADTWTLAATVIRNVLLNWLMLVPLLGAVLILPRFCSDVPAFDPSVAEVYAALIAGFIFAALSVAYVVRDLPGYGDQQGAQAAFLKGYLLPLSIAAFALTTFWAWAWRLESQPVSVWQFAAFGVAIHWAGWLRCAFRVDRGKERQPWRCPPRTLVNSFLAAAFSGAVGGVLVWWVFTSVLSDPIANIRLYACLAVPALLGAFGLAGVLLVGAASKFTSDGDREWWARGGGWMLIAGLVWLAGATLVLYGPDTLRWLFHQVPKTVASAGGISGILSIWLGHSDRTSASERDKGSGGWQRMLADIGLKASVPVFVVFLIILVALGTDELVARVSGWLDKTESITGPLPLIHALTVHFPGWPVFLALAGVGLFAARFVDVNQFSLHAMYRNRLIRAYLGASHEGRRPNPFTGFDPEDDVAMTKLKPEAPMHVVNMALNLVADGRLAWQQRKAESFTVTRMHAGNYRIGYRDSGSYGGGVSLGTAVTISGAAASPNMGYHSSPVITFLMTLFNARLGWWLGNPGDAGANTWTLPGPHYSVRPLWDEALGFTTDTNPYVYLSDGGHFENLALYEMILRRCGFIVVVDAGCDPNYTFEDLGNAVRKIRIDFGVQIEFRESPLKTVVERDHCAVADVRYSSVDGGVQDGVLLYIKPVLTGDEPADVANYASSDKAFPHQSTADQWFDESQFESYRRLGLHSIEEILVKTPVLVRAAGA